MGYIRDQHGRLCCDFCCNSGGVRKMRCPYGWCQSLATCPACRKLKKHIGDGHLSCKQSSQKTAQELAQFRAGGLHLVLKYDVGYFDNKPFYRVQDPWYSAACDHFNKTWIELDETDKLTALGHTFEILPREAA